jgi:hypothetical protein
VGPAHAQDPQRVLDRDVHILTDEDVEPRGAPQAVLDDVVPAPLELMVGRGSQGDDVPLGGSPDESTADLPARLAAVETEQLNCPVEGDLLGHGDGRRGLVRARPGVPAGLDEDLRAPRGGVRTTGDEAAEAGPGAGHYALWRAAGQRVEHHRGALPDFGQRTAELRHEGRVPLAAGVGSDGTLMDRVKEAGG